MSKKLIAAMLALTAVFVCIFAACNKDKEEKEKRPYIDNDEYEFVTDENGNRVLDENGEYVIYATDEDGKRVTNENGENVTVLQQFKPIQDGNVFEEYGYKITLPEGWSSTEETGAFENKEKSQSFEISVVNYKYPDYYSNNLDFYQQLSKNEKLKVDWTEEVEISKDYNGLVRFTMETEEEMAIMYFFSNNSNTYKILFSAKKGDSDAIKDTETVLKAITYKPFNYYFGETETAVKVTNAPAID